MPYDLPAGRTIGISYGLENMGVTAGAAATIGCAIISSGERQLFCNGCSYKNYQNLPIALKILYISNLDEQSLEVKSHA